LLLGWLTLSFLAACGAAAGIGGSQEVSGFRCSFTYKRVTLSWVKQESPQQLGLEPRVGEAKLPLKFDVYSISNRDLDVFMKAAKSQDSSAEMINLPLPGGSCYSYRLQPSEIMPEPLAQKFPELISLKGYATEDKAATVRLDYDGKKLQAEITRNGHIYYLAPWPGKEGTYYLLYKKEDAGFEKRPFRPY